MTDLQYGHGGGIRGLLNCHRLHGHLSLFWPNVKSSLNGNSIRPMTTLFELFLRADVVIPVCIAMAYVLSFFLFFFLSFFRRHARAGKFSTLEED